MNYEKIATVCRISISTISIETFLIRVLMLYNLIQTIINLKNVSAKKSNQENNIILDLCNIE